MSKTVYFLGLDDDGDDVHKGSVTWDGQRLSVDGDEWLRRLLKQPIICAAGKISAHDDPEAFLQGLHQQYRSPYLRATQPK